MRHKIRTTYRQSRDGDFANLAYTVVESLKDNPSFANPTPSLSVVETALQEYREALVNAVGKDKAMISVKNDKRNNLHLLLSELGNYVMSISQGDKSLLLTTGFEMARDKAAALAPISKMLVEIGPPGEAVTRVNRVPGARAYVHQCTAEPEKSDAGWLSYTSTDRQYRFTNLPSAVKHWFRVVAVGTGNQSVCSVTEARIIQ